MTEKLSPAHDINLDGRIALGEWYVEVHRELLLLGAEGGEKLAIRDADLSSAVGEAKGVSIVKAPLPRKV